MHSFKNQEVQELVKTIEEENPKELIVPDRLNKPHPLITEFRRNTKSYTEFRTDITRLSRGKNTLGIEVTKYTLKRALIFFNVFINLVKARGHEVTIEDNDTFIVIKDQKLKIRLREPNKVHDAKDERGWNTRSYSTSGELMFMFETFHVEKEWKDTKNVRLESKLAVIIAFLELKADEEIRQKEEWRIQREIRKREEELERFRQEQYDKEKVKYLKLVKEAQRWTEYTDLKKYVEQMQTEGVKSQEWLQWANEKLNWLDPRTDSKDELLGDYAGFEEKHMQKRVEEKRLQFMW